MSPQTLQTLREIGRQLDDNLAVNVQNDGIVTPSAAIVSSVTLGEESYNAEPATGRSETRPRTRAASRQGQAGGYSTGRPWASGRTASLLVPELRAHYEEEIGRITEFYPGTELWDQEQGVWLLVRSSLLYGLTRRAIFATYVSYAALAVYSWAFWEDLLTPGTWIGPRHTNFPDGSICAFEPDDSTWVYGRPIVKLFDFYSVWAVRHLHLEVFGRWPGRQSVKYAYERILELRDDEFCGCTNGDKLYGDCCKSKDIASSQIPAAIDFFFFSRGRLREPPKAVVDFVHRRSNPSRFEELF